MKKTDPICPGCGASMPLCTKEATIQFRGREITVEVACHVCPDCGLEAGTPEQACTIQAAIAEAYRFQEGMMTGREITETRWSKGLSQEELAEKTGFPLREIQCWEAGAIQSREQDDLLRQILTDESSI
ncbi:type II TA system antitoxin MqsA family protein [Desulfatibacillum aliphaticivorans]|uniref:Transcriptional regulator, XRE family n=1 Tax=Desulfatibacillum aliphaticivorans TaxID=218208 RepID=B8FKT9_DESAL|nr:type II TA system antitoxin MqsA family protein [Desulfatibacillum aliphaticivorans]ACL04461.1 putative transcriptional regulator, XRE family [Desulfatibacillum aliphaticivorans]